MKPQEKKIKLSAQVEESLRGRILNLEYPPNFVLVEENLCLEFGVSRSPIREALRSLESAGLIHKAGSRSYVVKQISQTGIREVYEYRLALESQVVKKLCFQPDRPELAELLGYWRNLDLGREPDLALADRLFHERLAEIYGNSVIIEGLQRINERLQVFREIDLSQVNRTITTKDQHVKLLEALVAGNVEEALKYIEINIYEGLENAVATLREAILKAYES